MPRPAPRNSIRRSCSQPAASSSAALSSRRAERSRDGARSDRTCDHQRAAGRISPDASPIPRSRTFARLERGRSARRAARPRREQASQPLRSVVECRGAGRSGLSVRARSTAGAVRNGRRAGECPRGSLAQLRAGTCAPHVVRALRGAAGAARAGDPEDRGVNRPDGLRDAQDARVLPRVQGGGMMLDALDRTIVAATEAGLPLVPEPYRAIADSIAIDEAELLARLHELLDRGAIRRIGAVPNHYALGFTANGMSVWDVADAAVEEVGRTVGALPFVTHCYQRSRHPPLWPYNLFAMVHGRSRAEVRDQVARIAAVAGTAARAHDILFSTRVLKKTGLRIAS